MTCFVVDDDSLGYYIMLNFPIVVYVVVFIYVYFTYGRNLITSKKSLFNSNPNSEPGLSEHPLLDKD